MYVKNISNTKKMHVQPLRILTAYLNLAPPFPNLVFGCNGDEGITLGVVKYSFFICETHMQFNAFAHHVLKQKEFITLTKICSI